MSPTSNTIKVFNPTAADAEKYNNDAFVLYYGLDVLVPFNNEIFEFTRDPRQAELVAFNGPDQFSDPGSCLTQVSEFKSHFSAGTLFVDCQHLHHIAEGGSDVDHTLQQVDFLEGIFGDDTHVMMLVTNMLFNNNSQNSKIYYTDFLWNRQMLFYRYQPDCVFNSGQEDFVNHWYPSMSYDPDTKQSYWDKTMYELRDIRSSQFLLNDYPLNNPEYIMRGYVSLTRTRNTPGTRSEYTGYQVEENMTGGDGPEVRDYLRTQLINLLKYYPGYLGDASAGTLLVGQGDTLSQRIHEHIKGVGNLGWTPAHNAYYENSTLSIYVETLTYNENQVIGITEKTWEPVIKGHFLLPFGYNGMIRDLQHHYGLKMAPFINYEYDSAGGDLNRWVMYLAEVKRLLNLGPRKLYKLKQQHMDILEYNRQAMLDTGYRDTVDEAIKRYMEYHQCFLDKTL